MEKIALQIHITVVELAEQFPFEDAAQKTVLTAKVTARTKEWLEELLASPKDSKTTLALCRLAKFQGAMHEQGLISQELLNETLEQIAKLEFESNEYNSMKLVARTISGAGETEAALRYAMNIDDEKTRRNTLLGVLNIAAERRHRKPLLTETKPDWAREFPGILKPFGDPFGDPYTVNEFPYPYGSVIPYGNYLSFSLLNETIRHAFSTIEINHATYGHRHPMKNDPFWVRDNIHPWGSMNGGRIPVFRGR